MFGKITNMTLLNRLGVVEKKLDIILQKIEQTNSKSSIERNEEKCDNQIICECKNTSEKLKNIDESFECFKDIMNGYRIDVVSSLEIITEHISKGSNTIDRGEAIEWKTVKDILERIQASCQLDQHNQDILKGAINNLRQEIEGKLESFSKSTNKKLDVLYYENELIKHQLLLETEIRKYEDELNNLRQRLSDAIQEINETLERI